MTDDNLKKLINLKEKIDMLEKSINNNTGKIEDLKQKRGCVTRTVLSFYTGSEMIVYISKECILKEMEYNLKVDKLKLIELQKTFKNL